MINLLKINSIKIAFLLFIFSLILRIILFTTTYNNLRYGAAGVYGSTSIGFYFNEGLTYNDNEISKIFIIPNNYTDNYLNFHCKNNRKTLEQFLPGPAALLVILWKLIPFYNFLPYILFQAILESILIGLFYFVFKDYDKYVALITSIFMVLNLSVIKRTLEMGDYYWPIAAILVTFIGIIYIIKSNKNSLYLFATGFITGLILWFNSITIYLPIFISFMIIYYYRCITEISYKSILKKILAYLIPIIISIILLSWFRFNITGDYRPMRSQIWHTFFCGVGQFENPYGIKSKDNEVWELGKKLNSDLEKSSFSTQCNLPNSPYEITLKKEAINFIRKCPHLFIRNAFYRIGIMISPFLYRGGDFIPSSLFNILLPIGIVAFILWFSGMYYLFRRQNLIFWLSATIYFYFFATFGWFCVVGRVILPFLFINAFVYLFGIKYLFLEFKKVKFNVSINTES